MYGKSLWATKRGLHAFVFWGISKSIAAHTFSFVSNIYNSSPIVLLVRGHVLLTQLTYSLL